MDARREELLALARRCEEASEGSAELDGAIALATGWVFDQSDPRSWYPWRKSGQALTTPPPFSASLNCALSLVGHGLCVDIRRCDDGETGYAEVRSSDMTPDDADDELYVEACAVGGPALAMSAAALRARAATLATEVTDGLGY